MEMFNGDACTVCHGANLKTTIDLGLQPPANRFINQNEKSHTHDSHRLAFGYCADCGTSQLTERMPLDSVRPRYEWLVYNEPEGHLDAVVSEVIKLPGLHNQSKILGITYKDQSTIDRLSRLGYTNGRCIDVADYHYQNGFFGLETIQMMLRDKSIVEKLVEKYGKADLVIMRHVIEHSDNAAQLIQSLKPLVSDGGYLLLELPDSEKILATANHAFLWEEHISYFTDETIRSLSTAVGATVAWIEKYPYRFEDSILVALSFDNAPHDKATMHSAQVGHQLTSFTQKYNEQAQHWRQRLSDFKQSGKKVAVFGAGHLAVKFINFYGLKDLLDCVVDDNANKANMLMPGSLLPIVPSSALAERDIKICISTLSPESEIKVKNKLSSYFDDGGIFISAFAE